MPWLSLVAVVVVGILGWNLYRRFGTDRIQALNEKRRDVPAATELAAQAGAA
jgi:hypothetical protein